MEIRGKKILITGAAKRVGRVIAKTLAERGAHIALHYNASTSAAEATAREIRELGVEVDIFQADLRQLAALEKMVDRVYTRFGQLDVLVNNASVFLKTPLQSLSEQDWDTILDANLKGPFFLSIFVGRRMLQAGLQGKIISIADWAGERPYRDYVPYCISKAGIIAMTKGLAKTLAPKVAVMAVAPGPVLWPKDLGAAELEAVLNKTPLKRLGTPEDVATTVAFIIEGSDYMTGSMIFVDGGRLAY
ncbi:MAG: SDR family oxidoreductase [Acidobacteria bacterium]|nr:SDR family oxidoreductase [Acidobacteriota bacterium]